MSLLPLENCPPVVTLPSTWEQETLDLYTAFRESNNPISIPVASAFDSIVKLAKAGGGGVDTSEYSSEYSSDYA